MLVQETLTRAIYAPHGESYLALPEGAKAAQTDIKLKGVLLLHPPLVKESFVDHMKHGIHRSFNLHYASSPGCHLIGVVSTVSLTLLCVGLQAACDHWTEGNGQDPALTATQQPA